MTHSLHPHLLSTDSFTNQQRTLDHVYLSSLFRNHVHTRLVRTIPFKYTYGSPRLCSGCLANCDVRLALDALLA